MHARTRTGTHISQAHAAAQFLPIAVCCRPGYVARVWSPRTCTPNSQAKPLPISVTALGTVPIRCRPGYVAQVWPPRTCTSTAPAQAAAHCCHSNGNSSHSLQARLCGTGVAPTHLHAHGPGTSRCPLLSQQLKQFPFAAGQATWHRCGPHA